MNRARVMLLAAALLLPVACSDPLPPVIPADLDGIWDWTSRTVDAVGGYICHDTGSLRLDQADSVFTGRSHVVGSCTGPFGTAPTERVDSVHGEVAGDTVTFGLRVFFSGLPDRCTLSGDIVVGPGVLLTGVGICGTATVTWQATPRQPLSSVAVSPATQTRVVSATTAFVAELRNSVGNRVFFRPVTWATSSASIATVDTLGAVVAVGPGTATITATSENLSGQGSLVVPVPAGLIQVSAGNAFTCALDAAGAASCWGLVFGAGRAPTAVAGGLQFAAISTSRAQPHQAWACGLTPAGAAYCWGEDDHGQLGNGTMAGSTTPVAVSGGHVFVSLSVGGRHVCGRTASTVYCWGENSDGQLGNNSTTDSPVPVLVSGLNAIALSAGGTHTCAVASGGAAHCWGNGEYGQLGDSTLADRLVPTPVMTMLMFNLISAGERQTCGIATGGSAWCWGLNGQGQLGTGGTTDWIVPAPVAGGQIFSAISIGSIHGCALTPAGAAYCWGVNSWGQLGTGSFTNSLTPNVVSGGHTFASISAGVYLYSDEAHNDGTSGHTCGVTTGGITWCWGDNLTGQIGDGTSVERTVPTRVAGQP